MQEPRLGQAESEGDCALLGARGEAGGGHTVQEEGDIIAVRALKGHAGGHVAGYAAPQRLSVRLRGSGRIGEAIRRPPLQPRPVLQPQLLGGSE